MENSLPCLPISNIERAGQPDRWALGHAEICYISPREWVYSVTLNKEHKEHLLETNSAVLTNAECGEESDPI